MSLFKWFLKEPGKNQKQTEEIRLGNIHTNHEVNGLDFVSAVEAHQAWKGRLFKYIVGTSEEKLDHEAVCHDDRCSLGKWIYSEGKIFCSNFPEFHKLKAEHAAFHISAGEIVEAVNNGDKQRAEVLLKQGDFSAKSRGVLLQLSKLYSRFQ